MQSDSLAPSLDRLAEGDELVVVVRVTEACSLGCRFCGYSREVRRRRTHASVDRLLALADVLRRYGEKSGRSVLVSWLGGEPLDWFELPRLVRAFHRVHGLRLGVTTNGLALGSAAVRAELIDHYEQVTISVDGLAEFHDSVRGQAGLFETLRCNVTRLRDEDKQARLLLRINTVLMRGNIDDFASFCSSLADWGVHELTFNQLGGNERPEFYPENRLLPEQVERFRSGFESLREQLQGRGLRLRGTERYLDRIASTAAGTAIPIDDCHPGQRFLFVDEQGRVSPCSFTGADCGVWLSEIDSPEALDLLPKRFAERRLRAWLPPCHDCHATHVFEKFAGDDRRQENLEPCSESCSSTFRKHRPIRVPNR